VRSKLELAEKIGGLEVRLDRAAKAGLAAWVARLRQARRVLASPERRIEDAMMRLDDLLSRMENAQAWLLTQGESRLREAYRALLLLSPRHRVHRDGLRLDHLVQRLVARTSACVERQVQALSRVGAILDSLSPLAILKRGYSITYSLPSREILTEAGRVRRGDAIEVRLYDGELTARIVADPKQGKLIG
jgi:exodeoxyribonuclease VII large subunit